MFCIFSCVGGAAIPMVEARGLRRSIDKVITSAERLRISSVGTLDRRHFPW
jgi:hypothetical protein